MDENKRQELITMDYKNSDYAAGLRQLADLLDANPEADFGLKFHLTINGWLYEKQNMADLARQVHGWTKDYMSDMFMLRKEFGPIKFDVNIKRSKVCKLVETGEQVIPAQPETVIPAQAEKVVKLTKWVCDEPLLA